MNKCSTTDGENGNHPLDEFEFDTLLDQIVNEEEIGIDIAGIGEGEHYDEQRQQQQQLMLNNLQDDYNNINSQQQQQQQQQRQLFDNNNDNTDQTLRQWINSTKLKYHATADSDGNTNNTSSSSAEYIRAALPLAIKLIEFFIFFIDKEKGGDILLLPLECINAKNVYLRFLQNYRNEELLQETIIIDSVWIMRSPNDSDIDNPSSTGCNMQSRLFAVGLILYELFSTEEPLLNDDIHVSLNASTSVSGINLDDSSSTSDYRPQKRTYQSSSQTGDKVDTCVAKLERKGLPRSICILVKNLLDCSRGDYCGDETYSSFVELRQDLLLMMNDPTRYLDDLKVSTSLPTLEICNKLYGRQDEEARLNELYQQFINEKKFKGVVISGGAGAGKSMLALHTQRLTSQFNGHFCSAKFEQNEMNNQPLATIGGLFNTLCGLFAAEGLSPDELELVEKELVNRLGNQASLLAGVVPSLIKLMPSYSHQLETFSTCIDAAVSMRYLFGELLRVISSNSKRPISLFIDDLQFGDDASLHLIGYLIHSAKGGSSVFFIFCHRDDEESLTGPFSFWLSSISMVSMESIELKNMSVESVNTLVSDTLHSSPRITRPLSAILHHKTRGNPLFLRQLLGSLYRKGYIYVDLSLSRWAWDMDKIEQEPVSSSVIALLTKEMKDLPSSLRLGLGVASCLGSSVKKEVLDILSKDLNVDFVDILKEVSQKGFMTNIKGGEMFRFTHDKIQEAGMYYLFVWMVLIQLVRFLPHSH